MVYYFMLRRYWIWGGVLAASSVLLVGCASAPGRKPASQEDRRAASVKHEPREDKSAEKLAQAHAHYSAGIIHEMEGESHAAAEEYYQAALLDPNDETLVLEVSHRLLQSKQSDRALEVVTRAAAQPDASGEIYARLGQIYAQLGKTNQAVVANRTAIKKSPESLTGYQNLYRSYLGNNQTQEALKVLDEAARQTHPDAEFLTSLAELYMGFALQAPAQKESANAKALALLNRAEKLGPLTPLLRLKLADGFNVLGDSTRAAQLYLEVLKHPPDLPLVEERVRANLTAIYLRGSDHKRAVEQLQAILRDDPTNPQVYYYLGRMALEGKNPADAADYFSKAVLMSPDFESSYYYLAMAQIDLNRISDALTTLDKARQKFPQNFALEFYTALAFDRQKAYAEALRHFVTAEVIAKATDPKLLDESFYFQLGATCERKGDYAQAEQYFQKSLQLSPNNTEAMNYLGYMWAEHDMKLDQARELIEKAVKAEPKNTAFLDSLAWVLFKQKHPKEGLPYALKAAELSEKPDATIYDHIGDIYAALNELDKAREAWRKSLSAEKSEEVSKKLESSGPK